MVFDKKKIDFIYRSELKKRNDNLAVVAYKRTRITIILEWVKICLGLSGLEKALWIIEGLNSWIKKRLKIADFIVKRWIRRADFNNMKNVSVINRNILLNRMLGKSIQ